MGLNCKLLDLSKAYLQLQVNRDLWKYQVIQHKGKNYYLSRLGFGLSCAPRIMSRVLKEMLAMDPLIQAATDHYIDDIIVNEDITSMENVANHLKKFGLVTKLAENLHEARVLGLQICRDEKSVLIWKRGNHRDDVVAFPMNRHNLFSMCGKLLGHYPDGFMAACG